MTWILIQPAPDLPGQFVAHHLETDVVSQGDDPRQALAMCREALKVSEGTTRAPEEFFTTLKAVQDLGEPASLDDERDVWAVEGDRVIGLRLRDHPGLKIVSSAVNLP